jgi:magnesium transporter
VPPPSPRSRREIPIVLATTVLGTFAPLSRAGAFALADLGIAAFFLSGVTQGTFGTIAPWFVLAAAVLSLGCRALDIESWALFIPHGLVGRVREAFGGRAAVVAAASLIFERLFFVALACLVAGNYATTLLVNVTSDGRFESHPDLATLSAAVLLGFLWIRSRLGYPTRPGAVSEQVWIAVAILAVLVFWSIGTVAVRSRWPFLLARPVGVSMAFPDGVWQQLLLFWSLLTEGLIGLSHALPAVGSGDSLTRAAAELPPPRIRSLRRLALLTGTYAIGIVALVSFLFGAVVPGPAQSPWFDAPLVGLAQHAAGPEWLRFLMTIALTAAAVVMLTQAADAAFTEARNALLRVAEKRRLPGTLLTLHPRFGTLSNLIDAVAVGAVLVLLASGGRVGWLARAYALGLGVTLVLKSAALVKLRPRYRDAPFRLPLTWHVRGREWPVGLWVIGVTIGGALLALLLSGDPAAFVAAAILSGLTALFVLAPERASPSTAPDALDSAELLPSAQLSLDQIQPRAGTVLVPVRNPYSLGHVVAALQTSRDREVVVMTARMLGPDAEHEGLNEMHPTVAEREIFSRVVATAERYQRPIRLLIVPARNIFDAIVEVVLRLQASEIYVGESVTLSADAQARLLGEAWERSEKSEGHEVHLVIHHKSGRTDMYHIGAHAPALSSGDLDLIHRLWLDASKSVGPHVHHHDIVRAALIQMADQLNGPERDDALRAIQRAAKPADELAEVVRTRDYSRLRDMVRNQPPSELAALLADLGSDEQAVVFRLLPRKDASATFEYLSTDSREELLRAMAKEDVAALLNNMAPDDRTMFLEELPATATRELLTLLSPEERSVAVTLLGYPEGSIGRLMTPHYVAVREDWTVRQVLDYVRQHGQDSETLNVIYVVDEGGMLIDDVRIREFLLTSTDSRVSDLMDRHFVALKATDDQQTAVAVFKQHDRSALPVTDTAGMLIGIVTVDDVLDVAEATATKDIQRIGGLEALDEPYMQVGFARMIQKRAGWLTALFLGEMLTATAMGAFEREIQKAVVLALFVPLIISSGGNSGSQASTLVIRALALGEVTLLDWWRVMRRELAAGLALGTILGAIGFFRISIWSAFSTIYGEHWLLVAFTVGLALIGIVLWGTLIGSLLPFLLRRLGFDPATSSAPFVATLVDVTGLVIYFSVALIVLRGTLL